MQRWNPPRQSAAKRAFDLVGATVLLILTLPVAVAVALLILVLDGRPIFYVSERMCAPDRSFRLLKFRTMRHRGPPRVACGDARRRLTRFARFLRRTRIDELPQLLHVIRGDMSLVGPRPILREHAEAHPELYRSVLPATPGMTGLATLLFFQREGRILERTVSQCESEAVYFRYCVPRKARLDMIYLRHRSILFDAVILFRTIGQVLRYA